MDAQGNKKYWEISTGFRGEPRVQIELYRSLVRGRARFTSDSRKLQKKKKPCPRIRRRKRARTSTESRDF